MPSCLSQSSSDRPHPAAEAAAPSRLSQSSSHRPAPGGGGGGGVNLSGLGGGGGPPPLPERSFTSGDKYRSEEARAAEGADRRPDRRGVLDIPLIQRGRRLGRGGPPP